MKKLYLILLVPSLTVCGDNPIMHALKSAFQAWQEFEKNNPAFANKVKEESAKAVLTIASNIRDDSERHKQNERCEIYRLEQERLKLEAEKKSAIEQTKRAQEEAKRTEELLGQQFDRCLNSNFHCRENDHGFPRRCNSPASRYAAVNEAAIDQKVAAFKKRRAVANQQQFRMWF